MLRRHENLRGTTNTLAVDSVDASVAAVMKAGGKQVIPKMPIPGVGFLAYREDTEGNLFGMMQSDRSAK